MELRQLRYFLAVVEDLHFTRAAERLHVAQPALSLQIRQLEEELGVQLLERLKHRVLVTPAGEAFARRARQVLEQTALAASDAIQIGRGEAGTVSLGFVSSAVFSLLPRILRSIRDSQPSVNLDLRELDPTEQLYELRSGRLDLGVMHALTATTDLEVIVLAHERLVVALPEDHPAAREEAVHLSELAGETFLLPKRHECGGIHEVVLGACQRSGFVPLRIQSTRLLQTAVCLVARNIGVALVPESFQNNLHLQGLTYRALATPQLEVELMAVWLRTNQSKLLDMLKGKLKQSAGT
jgi:DNA-binding transcriptional LysR family regulator